MSKSGACVDGDSAPNDEGNCPEGRHGLATPGSSLRGGILPAKTKPFHVHVGSRRTRTQLALLMPHDRLSSFSSLDNRSSSFLDR